MYRFGGRLCVVLALTLAGIDCFQWTADLPDDTVEYACANDDLRLPWDYSTSAGDDITDIQWFFQGHSQELIAIYSHGNFAPMAAFANRVQFVSNAGLILSHVVGGDSGNYSVEISGHDASGSFFTHRRTVMVQITDNDQLMTTDGHLHATLEPQAIYSKTTGKWSLVVSCGNFTYLGDPPFVMEWLTESGVVSPSGRYEDGEFQLEVLTGGDYTCRIPQQAAADACLVHSSREATIHIDKTEARLILVEARQAQLQRDNDILRDREANLTDYVRTLETRLEDKDNRLEEKDSNLTRYIQDLEQRLDAKDRLLDDKDRLLEAKDSSLTQSLQGLSTKVNQRVGFNARASSGHTAGGRIVYNQVIWSYGQGYSSSTGIFTARIAGLYFFMVTSTPHSDQDSDTSMRMEDSVVCVVVSYVHGAPASCSAVVHLNVGQRVWAESSYHLNNPTYFSGFLINSDH